jgi:hypothetical protein
MSERAGISKQRKNDETDWQCYRKRSQMRRKDNRATTRPAGDRR